MGNTPRSQTVASVQKHLRAESTPDASEKAKRFFKADPGEYAHGDIFLGLKAATMHALAKEHSQLSIADLTVLLQSEVHEDRMLSLLVLRKQFKKATESGKEEIYCLYLANTKTINNWDLVDASAGAIVGGYLKSRERKPLYKLAKSKSLWERRISIVATQPWIKERDFKDTIAIARILLDDKEDLIHKASGWMLREVGQRDEGELERFLDQHASSMPRTMLRYAIEHFSQERRQRILAESKKS